MVGWWVAHKILVTSPEAKYLCYLFGAFLGFGLWTGTWPRACQLMYQQEKRDKLVIWDAPGQERFRSLLGGHNIYRGSKGVILVYDMSSRESFAKLENWLKELENHSTNHDLIIKARCSWETSVTRRRREWSAERKEKS